MSHPRREFLLGRLRAADGITYDELIRAAMAAFPERNRYIAGMRCARCVRMLLWDRLAVTGADESVWLTPEGWQATETADSRITAVPDPVLRPVPLCWTFREWRMYPWLSSLSTQTPQAGLRLSR